MIHVSKTDDGRYQVIPPEGKDSAPEVTICLTFGEVDRVLRALGASNEGVVDVRKQLADSGSAELRIS